ESKFKEVSEAYEVLSDSDKRAKYDRFGDEWKAYSQGGAPGGRTQTGGVEVEYGAEGLSDFLESIFGNWKMRAERAQPPPTQGEDVEFGLDLTLEEAIRGTKKNLTVNV